MFPILSQHVLPCALLAKNGVCSSPGMAHFKSAGLVFVGVGYFALVIFCQFLTLSKISPSSSTLILFVPLFDAFRVSPVPLRVSHMASELEYTYSSPEGVLYMMRTSPLHSVTSSYPFFHRFFLRFDLVEDILFASFMGSNLSLPFRFPPIFRLLPSFSPSSAEWSVSTSVLQRENKTHQKLL